MMSIDGIGGSRGFGIDQTNTGGRTEGPANTRGVGGGVANSGGALPPGIADTVVASLTRAFSPPEDTNAARTRLENSGQGKGAAEFEAALKDLLSAVRDPDMLGKLLIEMSSMSRQNALDARLAARSQARGELEAQAGQTREAAQKMLASAIVGAVVAVVSAVITIGGASKAAGQLKQSAMDSMKGVEINKIMDKTKGLTENQTSKLTHMADATNSTAKIAQGKADIINQVTGALSNLFNAVKGLTEGTLNAAAKMSEATGQEFAASAQDSQANADLSKKFMDELEEMINTALKFIKELQQAETDMMATASRL